MLQTVQAVVFLSSTSQADLSCHICHLWWMTSTSSREELKKQSLRGHSRAAQTLFWTKQIDVFLFPALYSLPSEEQFFCTPACLPARLWQCSSKANSEGVYARVLVLLCLTALWFLSLLSNFRFGCVVTFHDISPPVSVCYIFKMQKPDCSANYCSGLTAKCQWKAFLEMYYSVNDIWAHYSIV